LAKSGICRVASRNPMLTVFAPSTIPVSPRTLLLENCLGKTFPTSRTFHVGVTNWDLESPCCEYCRTARSDQFQDFRVHNASGMENTAVERNGDGAGGPNGDAPNGVGSRSKPLPSPLFHDVWYAVERGLGWSDTMEVRLLALVGMLRAYRL
jgi:hypothetical protein